MAWILLRCRCGAPTSLPIQYFIVKDGNNSSPSIVDRLDKPLLLLPQGPDLNIPEISEGDRQAAVEDALSRAVSRHIPGRVCVLTDARIAAFLVSC